MAEHFLWLGLFWLDTTTFVRCRLLFQATVTSYIINICTDNVAIVRWESVLQTTFSPKNEYDIRIWFKYPTNSRVSLLLFDWIEIQQISAFILLCSEQPAKWGAIENGQKLHLPKEMLREVAAEQTYSTGNSMQSQFNAT